MKKLLYTRHTDQGHWVGDGFPVRTIFTYNDQAQDLSPFLLMDYGGPVEFEATKKIRGVGEHPHRGFETVTLVFAGEVEHRDSAGGGGGIGPGEVQWMTAASGLVHEEKHSKHFAETGGPFEMIQLWVNLPAKDKMGPPRYQGIKKEQIPELTLPEQAGTVRVIAGSFRDTKGPAKTHTAINLWTVHLHKHQHQTFTLPEGHNLLLFVRKGALLLKGGETIGAATLAVMDPKGETLELEASDETDFVLLSGAPIKEPIVGYGPFVMNTREEIVKAYEDFQSGLMGRIDKVEGSEPS